MILIDVVFLFLLFILGLLIPTFLNVSQEDRLSLKILWMYHLIFSVYYSFFLRVDSYTYWVEANNMTSAEFWEYIMKSGTYFVNAITYIPTNLLGLSYLSVTILFSLVGYIGMVYFYQIAVRYIPYNVKIKGIYLFPLLFFLPNLHLWSVAIGKDSLLFFCIGAFAYSLTDIKKYLPLMAFALILSYLVRPHITLILIFSFGFVFFISSHISKSKRILLSVLFVTVALVLLPSVMEHFKLDSLSEVDQFSDKTAENMAQGAGSAIDISSYPYPLKFFSFLYRPLFFDINGFAALIISFENLLLLILSIYVIRNHPMRTFRSAPIIIQGLFIFLLVGSLIFCSLMSNLGIIIRMRNMFLPGLLIYILWSFSYNAKCKLDGKK
ncbi:hypothetical protein M2451_000216 [Dysgonomonas sp. PFB1-18]|uniref:hypothetical protein n=1 Tax=unclassified Dysgonomonas TaxID=2630389 RepID=UPI0024733F17|nr:MULTISPECIES: hypothetical protein [unclassified Dysgonomonas]MDH6307767.1 hypothetical protein [Dysgonomonas sp. PF1-14]MDH6337685.1 hypothetical protein [Dysgonomonas sp. PF1-16]MDH6378909.1 hypothetical protein [Dysgonomonas sp. PFB1-18]MDH6396544.1 hypothetical protein [Dysgonomonas sp. PF1-23]